MNSYGNDYKVKYTDAEHVMNLYLHGLQGYHRQTPQSHARVIRSLLLSLISDNHGKKYLCCDKNSLLRWMIDDVRNKKINYAAVRLSVIDRYVKQLYSYGLLPDNPLRPIKPRPFYPSWDRIIEALQSPNPWQRLEMLYPPDSQQGPLYPYIQKYIDFQQSLEKKCIEGYRTLYRLDALLVKYRIRTPRKLKAKHINEWLGQMRRNQAGRTRHLFILRKFIHYLIGIGVMQTNPAIPVIEEYGVVRQNKYNPFILTKEQIKSILAEAGKLSPNKLFKLRPQVCRTMLTLLFALGLRNSEVRNLRLCDVNMEKSTLYIARTKFYKSRLVPFGHRVRQCLETYISVRCKIFLPIKKDDPLFITCRRRPIGHTTLGNLLRLLAKRVLPSNSRLPRIHDLRHAFAVHRLLKWYEDGDDVQSKLILLSTFMGHSEIHSTQVYLTVTMDLLKEANNRFYKHYGKDIQL